MAKANESVASANGETQLSAERMAASMANPANRERKRQPKIGGTAKSESGSSGIAVASAARENERHRIAAAWRRRLGAKHGG
jgi:hypothetical protein